MLSGELLRLVIVSASVLVTIVSFATAVKPLADGTLTAGQAMSFMALAAPPMLQYALPFAAGFAATLAYHRFASDNEANAAYAGDRASDAAVARVGAGRGDAGDAGCSIAPRPRLLRQMEQLVTRDIAQLLVNAVERGDSLRIQDAIIHADAADRLGPDPVSGARRLRWRACWRSARARRRAGVEATGRAAVVWLFDSEIGPARDHERPGARRRGGAFRGWGRDDDHRAAVDQSDDRARGAGASQTAGDVYRFTAPGAFRENPKFYDWRGRDFAGTPTR